MFTPPLYKQRYQFVKDLVKKHQPKKSACINPLGESFPGPSVAASWIQHSSSIVADLGCADCSLLWMLKFCDCIEELVGLDISEYEMKESMHMLTPLPCDYLQPSTRSLSITLYQGSVAQKDPVLLNFDMVASIELIEHLELAELEMFPEVVFGFMAPALVVISTPNIEFNHLFPKSTLFRHPDHKFEWNRAEFQSWASNAATHYGYTVEFTGVGAPPADAGDIGFCTQIGVFVRNYTETAEMVNSKRGIRNVYKTVFKSVYPSLRDEKYLQIAVVSETMNQVQRIKRSLLNAVQLVENGSPTQQFNAAQKQWPFGKCKEYFNSIAQSEADNIAQKRDSKPFIRHDKVYVPLAYLFSIPKVEQLCGTLKNLIKMVTGKVSLNHDGSAVKVKVHVENYSDCI